MALQSHVMNLPEMRDRRGNPVDIKWACEKDRTCIDVLKKTYHGCVFGDIFDINPENPHAYCLRHHKRCCTSIPPSKERYLSYLSWFVGMCEMKFVTYKHETDCECISGTRVQVTGEGGNMLSSWCLILKTYTQQSFNNVYILCFYMVYQALISSSS